MKNRKNGIQTVNTRDIRTHQLDKNSLTDFCIKLPFCIIILSSFPKCQKRLRTWKGEQSRREEAVVYLENF